MEENQKIVELKNISVNELIEQIKSVILQREVEKITFFISFKPKQSKAKGKGQKNLQDKTYEALNIAKQKKSNDQALQKFKSSFKVEQKQQSIYEQIKSLYEQQQYDKLIQLMSPKETLIFCKFSNVQNSGNTGDKEKFSNQYNTITFYLGNCFYRLKKYQNAIAYYKKSVQGEPIRQKAQRLNNLGSCYAIQKSFQLALKVYNESIKLYSECQNEDVSNLLNNIAMIYMKCEMLRPAQEYFQQSIKQRKKKSPNNKTMLANSYYNLGVCQRKLLKLQESLNSLSIAMNYACQGYGNKIDIINQICSVYQLQQKWSQALTHYQKLSQEFQTKNKNQGPIYYKVSKVHQRLGNTVLAAKFAKKAYKLYYLQGDERKLSELSGSMALNSAHYT